MTTPALYDVRIRHRRRQTLDRSFTHRSQLWLVDLDELPRTGFQARDHLGDPDRTIRANVEAYLSTNGIDLDGGRILMLAHARALGHVFNPITVYWCHHRDGRPAAVVAEVHNTYGERHCYLLLPDAHGRADVRADVDKEFYVSPFLSTDGHYRMVLPAPGERLSLAITLVQDGAPALAATVVGVRRPVTPLTLLRSVLAPHRTTALIRRHGIALWLRRLPVLPRPPHVPQEGVR